MFMINNESIQLVPHISDIIIMRGKTNFFLETSGAMSRQQSFSLDAYNLYTVTHLLCSLAVTRVSVQQLGSQTKM